jgi:cytochrome c oxidase assembly protein subunit 15
VLIPLLSLQIIKLKGNNNLKLSNILLIIALIVQITLGIFTVINSLNPDIFPTLGVLHQAGGMLLLMAILFVNYQFSRGTYSHK